jgi:hypothetical protein
MKSIPVFLGVILLVFSLPFVFNSVHDARTADFTESQAEIITAAGTTSANLTLARELWADDPASVSSIASSITEYPSATIYNEVTRALTISGLSSSENRTLVLVYDIANPNLENASTMGPVFIALLIIYVLGVITLLVAAIVAAIRSM